MRGWRWRDFRVVLGLAGGLLICWGWAWIEREFRVEWGWGYARWFDEPESLILAQSERWRHA